MDSLEKTQPTSLTESMQTPQPENAHFQQLQTPLSVEKTIEDRNLSSQQALMLPVKHVTEIDVLKNQEVDKTTEMKTGSVCYKKAPVSPDQQQQQGNERAIPIEIKDPCTEQGEVYFSNTTLAEVLDISRQEIDLLSQIHKNADTRGYKTGTTINEDDRMQSKDSLAKMQPATITESVRPCDTDKNAHSQISMKKSSKDQTSEEDQRMFETSNSQTISGESSLHHQTTSTTHTNATDTTLSSSIENNQKDTGKSMNAFSLDGKPTDGIESKDGMDFLENTERQLSDTFHCSNSEDIAETFRADPESAITTSVPSQLELGIHSEQAGLKEQAKDSDTVDCLQLEEMSKAKTNERKGGQCEGFHSSYKETRTVNQPAQGLALDTLLDISTNIQHVTDITDVSTVYQSSEATWLLEPSITELENQLERAVLRILKCRYHPAQLSTELMNQQLQEAENCRQYVADQLASRSQHGGSGLCQSMAERWSSAMLEATATVQIKEAQLQQVTQYHQQIHALQDTLQELEEELDSLSLAALKSSVLQAKKLLAFLKHMEQKKSMLDELMNTCCNVSSYLGEAEGPVACLIPVRNLLKKWQILESTANRTLRHAEHCMSEASILMKDAKILLGEVEVLHTSSPSSTQLKDCQRAIQEIITFSDIMERNERYLYLLELSQALFQCPLGEKEKEEISDVFQNLKSQMDCAQEKLCTYAYSPSDHLLAQITSTMKSWFAWAKQTENRITRKKKLSLFPEEASQQVDSIKKLESEISSRQFKLSSVVMKLKEEIAGFSQVDSSHMLSALQTLGDIYSKILEEAERVAADLNQMLHSRQRLDMQITDISTWLASLLEKESKKAAAIQLGSSITDMRVCHQKQKSTLKEAEKRLSIIRTLLDETKKNIYGLRFVDAFHLINKLTTLQEEISRVVQCKQTACWELEEILHAQESSAEEFSTIQKSLRQIITDLEKQRYPVSRDSLAAFAPIRHMLIEHLSQVLEVQHCQENQRKDFLRTILSLQEKIRLLDQQSIEHEEYLTSKKHLENHFEAVKKRVHHISDSSKDADKQIHMSHTLLVEIPMVKISCQRTAEQLEVISGDLFPSQVNSERQKIRSMLQSLTAWEHFVCSDVKNQEDSLLANSLSSVRELTPLTEHFMKVEEQLKQNSCLDSSDKAITIALHKCLTLERSVVSGLRVLEMCKDCNAIEDYGKTANIGRSCLNACTMQRENLLKAEEAVKDYRSAVRQAVGFLQQIDAKLLVPSAIYKDSKAELNHTQHLLTDLTKGFQDHMAELQTRLPPQACFSPQTEKLHIQVVSYLQVTDAKLKAQAQVKLEALQRCLLEQANHTKQHDDMNHLLQNFDIQLSESLSLKPISLEECKDQFEKIKVLQEDLGNMGTRLEDLKHKSSMLNCNVEAEKTLGHLQRHWVLLQQRLDTLKSRVAHTETQWKEIILRIKSSREALDHLQHSFSEISKMKGSLGKLQEIIGQTEQLQYDLDQEQLTLVSIQRSESRLLSALNILNTPSKTGQELQSLLSRCRSLREQSGVVRHDMLSEIQEWGRIQEELKGLQQSVLSLLSGLQSQLDTSHTREFRAELDSQNIRLQEIMDRARTKSNDPPQEIQKLHGQITLSLKEAKDKVGQAMERSGSLQRMSEHVDKVTVGLVGVEALLQEKSATVKEAESILKRVWDELDRWHARITELEVEVQELAEEQPERAHILMDELTKPLQLYQTVAKQAEQRTAFINRIPSCLQDYEEVLHSSTCWLAETQSWLKTPQTYTTAKCLHSHANSLQVVLDESERMQKSLETFGASLQEISVVFDTSTEERNLLQICNDISHMQHIVLEPISQLQHAAAEIDAIEAEVKTMEKSVTKIKSILSTVETEEVPPEEHLQNRQVILENLQSMQRTLAEIERCKDDLGLPTGAEHSLLVFQRAEQLHPHIHELQQLTEEQSSAYRNAIGHSLALLSSSDGEIGSNDRDVVVPMEQYTQRKRMMMIMRMQAATLHPLRLLRAVLQRTQMKFQ
ncbi:nesprin-2-like isoform X2 [Silurus meridionalis]|uniref:nesprin-2-like isoform X2 n=1 Tax=Silurus meridionalis TaxID=175797 RepID=UPI001EEAA5D0|nr:nesprin-2-like isoform X2 [Silurus meridionalis]